MTINDDYMEIKEIFQDIDWKSLAIGGTIFSLMVILAIDYQLDILLMFSSTGLLYIGYTSKNKIQSVVLGAIVTIPLFLAIVLTERLGEIVGESLVVLALIAFLAIGAFCGFIGAYLAKSRKKAIKQQKIRENYKSKKNKRSKNKNR